MSDRGNETEKENSAEAVEIAKSRHPVISKLGAAMLEAVDHHGHER